ncbi:MAG TPA: glycosyltransferase family 2 protein [Cyclobacteriaceae bacterium]|jgi:GT2 family glycosyltransferase|nr:glycosyltransferase family 2 protein [Cyclobacteriaceae bacterium]
MTSVAIVILNYNRCDLLRKYLPAIIEHSPHASIVVADNGSKDGSADMVEKEFSSIRVIRIAINLGFCGGYNTALRQIDADYYVLLNSDVEVTAGWVEPLQSILDHQPQVAAVQPKILSLTERHLFEYAGAGGGLIDRLGYPFCRGRLFYVLEPDNGQFNDSRPIFWSSGAAMMIRSSLYHEMGGLDEDFFAHMEEIDLCWRLQRAGHLIWYEGASTVYHLGGGTLSVSNPFKTYLNFKNGLSLLYKNLPVNELIIKFPIRIVLDWIAAVKFTLNGSWRDGWSVIRAHAHFFRHYGREQKRRKAAALFGYRTLEQQYKGSVVWAFFGAGKRRFEQLEF